MGSVIIGGKKELAVAKNLVTDDKQVAEKVKARNKRVAK